MKHQFTLPIPCLSVSICQLSTLWIPILSTLSTLTVSSNLVCQPLNSCIVDNVESLWDQQSRKFRSAHVSYWTLSSGGGKSRGLNYSAATRTSDIHSLLGGKGMPLFILPPMLGVLQSTKAYQLVLRLTLHELYLRLARLGYTHDMWHKWSINVLGRNNVLTSCDVIGTTFSFSS